MYNLLFDRYLLSLFITQTVSHSRIRVICLLLNSAQQQQIEPRAFGHMGFLEEHGQKNKLSREQYRISIILRL